MKKDDDIHNKLHQANELIKEGDAFQEAKNFIKAIQKYTSAIKLCEEAPSYLVSLAKAYIKRGSAHISIFRKETDSFLCKAGYVLRRSHQLGALTRPKELRNLLENALSDWRLAAKLDYCSCGLITLGFEICQADKYIQSHYFPYSSLPSRTQSICDIYNSIAKIKRAIPTSKENLKFIALSAKVLLQINLDYYSLSESKESSILSIIQTQIQEAIPLFNLVKGEALTKDLYHLIMASAIKYKLFPDAINCIATVLNTKALSSEELTDLEELNSAFAHNNFDFRLETKKYPKETTVTDLLLSHMPNVLRDKIRTKSIFDNKLSKYSQSLQKYNIFQKMMFFVITI